MWTLLITRNFLISFWKLDKFIKNLVLEDIADIQRHADVIEMFENIEIIDEYDGSIVVPEHMVNYQIDRDEEKVYIVSLNKKGIAQRLNNYRI